MVAPRQFGGVMAVPHVKSLYILFGIMALMRPAEALLACLCCSPSAYEAWCTAGGPFTRPARPASRTYSATSDSPAETGSSASANPPPTSMKLRRFSSLAPRRCE